MNALIPIIQSEGKAAAPQELTIEECYSVLRRAVDRRIAAMEPFYLAYAMEMLRRTSTIYALECVESGLTKIGRTRRLPTRAKAIAATYRRPTDQHLTLNLVHALPVHHQLELVSERNAHEWLEEYRVRGEWFDLRGAEAEEVAYVFSENAYVELVSENIRKVLPVDTDALIHLVEDRVTAISHWWQTMDQQLTAIEGWLAKDGGTRMFDHRSAGVTRFTFRAGLPPLAEYFEPWLAAFSGSPLCADPEYWSTKPELSGGTNPHQQKTG